MPTNTTGPTLLITPTTACPRCSGRRIVALAIAADSSFAWYECEECCHLWALPHGWSLHCEPTRVPQLGEWR